MPKKTLATSPISLSVYEFKFSENQRGFGQVRMLFALILAFDILVYRIGQGLRERKKKESRRHSSIACNR